MKTKASVALKDFEVQKVNKKNHEILTAHRDVTMGKS